MLRIEAVSGTDNESDRVTDVFAISITNNRRTDCSSDNESDYSPSNIITNYASDNIISGARNCFHGDGFG